MLSTRTSIALSIAIGVCLELGIHLASGRREAWDSSLYWTLGLPAAGLASLALGFFSASRNWASTVLVAPAQVLTMMIRSAEIGGFWPLTIVLSAILSAPFLLAAFIGSRFRPSAPDLGGAST
jgi:hypothetical protein